MSLCSPHWASIHIGKIKFDDALVELTRAIEINPKSATAQIIWASRPAKKAAARAEKEILQALANNPDDGDAHFNLAVILSLRSPARKNRETALARATRSARNVVFLEKLLQ